MNIIMMNINILLLNILSRIYITSVILLTDISYDIVLFIGTCIRDVSQVHF
jgi:hypothetical protein